MPEEKERVEKTVNKRKERHHQIASRVDLSTSVLPRTDDPDVVDAKGQVGQAEPHGQNGGIDREPQLRPGEVCVPGPKGRSRKFRGGATRLYIHHGLA